MALAVNKASPRLIYIYSYHISTSINMRTITDGALARAESGVAARDPTDIPRAVLAIDSYENKI